MKSHWQLCQGGLCFHAFPDCIHEHRAIYHCNHMHFRTTKRLQQNFNEQNACHSPLASVSLQIAAIKLSQQLKTAPSLPCFHPPHDTMPKDTRRVTCSEKPTPWIFMLLLKQVFLLFTCSVVSCHHSRTITTAC